MDSNDKAYDYVVFEYTGKGQSVPKDVVSVRFHPNVTQVGARAFYECRSLREVVLNEGLQKVGGAAFADCISLESITLPSTLTEIGCSVFLNRRRLREVVIMNETVETIKISGDYTFCCCSPQLEFKFPSISTRVEDVIEFGKWQYDIVYKITHLSGVQWREGEIVVPVPRLYLVDWTAIKSTIDQIGKLITHYTMKEVTTIVELAFWKGNMNQAEMDRINPADRETYRIEVPGPAKDVIMQYLKEIEKDRQPASSRRPCHQL